MNSHQTPHIVMDPSLCTGCWKCVKKCPKHAIGQVGMLWHKHVVFTDANACIGCKLCIKTCPHGVYTAIGSDDAASSVQPRRRHHPSLSRMLPVLMLGTFITGIGLHIAGHGMDMADHSVWHNWAVAHVIFSAICLWGGINHIRKHRKWFRHLHQKDTSISKVLLISATAIAFTFVTISGIVLLTAIDGSGSHIGLWHYGCGILLGLLSILHTKKGIR